MVYQVILVGYEKLRMYQTKNFGEYNVIPLKHFVYRTLFFFTLCDTSF